MQTDFCRFSYCPRLFWLRHILSENQSLVHAQWRDTVPLRNRMDEDRLSNLAFTNIHREFEVNTDKVIEEFKKRNNRRLFSRSLLLHQLQPSKSTQFTYHTSIFVWQPKRHIAFIALHWLCAICFTVIQNLHTVSSQQFKLCYCLVKSLLLPMRF